MAVSATPMPRGAPSLLHSRRFLVFTAGQFVSRSGDALSSVASLWLVLDLSGNNALASTTALAFQFLPFLLFGVIAGVLVDRWDRRWTMIIADSLRGLIILTVPILHATGSVEVWHVVLVGFAITSIGRLFTPARQAFLPELVEEAQLVRANAITEGSNQAAFVLGPALGGILVGVVGAANVFYFDAATFFVSAASLLLVRVPASRKTGRRTSIWREAKDGVSFVRGHPVLLMAGGLSLMGTFAFAPVPALLPVLVRGELAGTSRAFGILMACFFVGSVAGATVIARLGKRLHRGRTMIVTITAVGLATLALAGAPTAAIVGLSLALLGGITSGFNVAEFSLLQQQTPPEMRGRVFALSNLASQMLRPPALLLAGLLAEVGSVRLALAVMAVAALAAGALALSSRPLRATQ
jgi:MFS family permease